MLPPANAHETNSLPKLSISLIGSIVYLWLVFSLKRTTVRQSVRPKEAYEQAHCRIGSTDTGGLYH
jgi:hypothetical protein